MLYVITGGSGSGKSEYAENLAVRLYQKSRALQVPESLEEPGQPGNSQVSVCNRPSGQSGRLIYVATMFPYHDEESRQRIARHRQQRAGKGFSTLECFCGAERITAEPGDVLLLDCLSNLLANEMYLEEGSVKDRGALAEKQTGEAIVKPLLALGTRAELVVVTNEVFSDGALYDAESMKYIALLGFINTRLAERAAQVTEVVCGIPLVRVSDCVHQGKEPPGSPLRGEACGSQENPQKEERECVL